jgi:hypothetical protein
MAMITLIVGSAGMFVAGFAAWYTVSRLRVASRVERVPVKSARPLSARPLNVQREGAELGRDPE